MSYYGDVLALVHDEGFSGYIDSITDDVLALLSPGSRVIELGAGPGRFLRRLRQAGFDAVGFDLSAAMAARDPKGQVRVGDWRTMDLPDGDVVVALGEVLNYNDRPERHRDDVRRLMERCRGRTVVFDALLRTQQRRHAWGQGDGWFYAVDVREEGDVLTRHIVAFAWIDGAWRRAEETHTQIVWTVEEWVELLSGIGFEAKVSESFGTVPLPARHAAFVVR